MAQLEEADVPRGRVGIVLIIMGESYGDGGGDGGGGSAENLPFCLVTRPNAASASHRLLGREIADASQRLLGREVAIARW